LLFDVILLSFLNFLDLLFYFEFCVVCFFSRNTTFRLYKGLVYLKYISKRLILLNLSILIFYIYFFWMHWEALILTISRLGHIKSPSFFKLEHHFYPFLLKKNHVKVYFYFFNVGVRISLRALIPRAMKLTTM
jgi:hypothetical protein